MTDSTEIGPLDGLFDHVDWKESAAFGVGAWVIGLVISYAIVTISTVTDEVGPDASTTELAVGYYYEAIGGMIEVGGTDVFTGMIASYGLVDSRFWAAAIVIHYLVPLIVLTVAGYVLAGRYKHGSVEGVSDPSTQQVVIGGASLAVFFTGAMIVGANVLGGDASVDTGQLLFLSILYPLVFASFGAGLRSGARTLRSGWGFLGGFGALAVGFLLWYQTESPLDPNSFSDLSGFYEHFTFLASYVGLVPDIGGFMGGQTGLFAGEADPHALLYGETLPEWYVMVAFVAVGAAIVYRAETTDWVRGLGQGARIAVGYFFAVLFVTLAAYASHINEMYDAGATRYELVMDANLLFGATAPRVVIVSGIVWAVAFGAVGGAIGAKIVESQAEQAPAETGTAGGDPAE